MKLIYLKSALKCDSFDVAIGTKISFFRLLVTIELGRSLLQFITTNCLIKQIWEKRGGGGLVALQFIGYLKRKLELLIFNERFY